jgi:Tol biopolymer transport system component
VNGKIAFTSDSQLYTMNADGTGQLQLTGDGNNHSPTWSPDGTKIAFSRMGPQDTRTHVYLINPDGSGLQRITDPAAGGADPNWSPDGSKIAYAFGDSNSDIFVMNANGSNPVNVSNNPAFEINPVWSPDGSRIAFVSTRDLPANPDFTKRFEIYVMNANGSNVIRLTNNIEQDADPSWSPDGSKIAFSTSRDGNFEVYSMNADGTNQVNLSNNASSDFQPCWSPDGSKIAFLSFRDSIMGPPQEIFVMNANGSNPVRLTTSSLAEQELAWQAVAAGTKIVFGSVRNGGNHDIFTMDLNGSNQTRLTTSSAYDDEPKWSPDGTRIVFMSDRDGNFEIYTMNSDGSNQARLTNSQAADGFPVWSPDGTKIAFVSGDLRDPSTFEIYVMNANGSNKTRLTNDTLVDGVPAWSPDGTKIVFMSGATSVFNPNSFEIFVMNANGTGRTQLTSNSVVDGQPSYSPDGTKILFASGDAMNPNGIEIFVMNANGTGRTQLTTNSVTDGFPAWSPDGTKIIFASGSIGDETTVELFVMNADGGGRTQLTTNTALDWFADWQPAAPAGVATVQFNSANYNVGEGAGSAAVTVSRSGDTSGTATVEFFTSDGSALQRSDYNFASGSVSFAPGETSKTFNVIIVDDLYVESSETFNVVLGNTTGAIHGSLPSATVTITDNDATQPTTNPLDNSDAQFFVRQHYLDFLSREPDPNGFAFWTNQITQCGSDQTCLRTKRIDVSNAFFYELEYQQTGSYVYRLYRAAFGNNQPFPNPIPDFSHPGEERKVVAYSAFAPDRARVVGGANLAQAQQDFANAFVLRAEFQNKYPTSLDGPGFVDAVLATIKNELGADLDSQRTPLIAIFNSGGRGGVMYRLADDNGSNPINNQALINAEYNRAFVATEYYGYLRRDPDMAGFLFWLGQVSSAPLRDVAKQHAMVCSFITSAEYQQRFSPVVTHFNSECQ